MVLPPKVISVKDIKVPTKKAVPLHASDHPSEHVRSVATVDSEPVEPLPEMETSSALSVVDDQHDYGRMIRKFIGDTGLIRGKGGHVYLEMNDMGNLYHVRVGSKFANLFLRRQALKQGVTLRDRDLKEINGMLSAYAEMELKPVEVYLHVAPIYNGIEIDLGNDEHHRVRITQGRIVLVTEGSETVFRRSNVSLPFVKPAEKGNLKLIKKYLKNVKPEHQILIIAWISYTLAHPKITSSNFVHLILLGSPGSGKTFLCRLISRLVFPSVVGPQILPRNTKDLIVSAQNAHLLIYDNVRALTQSRSDDLCVAGTGGSLSARQLYTDDDQLVSYLHVALILNGIFDFVTESDLAQRSLIVYLQDMDESMRLSEVDLELELERDMPVMLQGLFQLIADIFEALPKAKVTHPERMVDFSKWLAAMEILDGAPAGIYQVLYSDTLKDAQLNTLLENELAAAVYRLADHLDAPWKGRPTDLLHELNERASFHALRSADWPKSPESLSKRLKTLTSALVSQGISIRFTKSNERRIEINTTRIEEQY